MLYILQTSPQSSLSPLLVLFYTDGLEEANWEVDWRKETKLTKNYGKKCIYRRENTKGPSGREVTRRLHVRVCDVSKI
jgi:hypothetical protein